jgi:hypothetical protein
LGCQAAQGLCQTPRAFIEVIAEKTLLSEVATTTQMKNWRL